MYQEENALFQSYCRRSPKQYGYLRCLSDTDRNKFQQEMIHLIMKNCPNSLNQMITAGYINLGTWVQIMERINLSQTYQLWRPASWNESTGHIGPYSTIYHVPIQTFYSATTNRQVVNLIYKNGHITPIWWIWLNPSNAEVLP